MPLSHLPGLLSDLQSYQSGLSAHWLQVLSKQVTFVLFGQPIHWLEVLTIQMRVVLSGWSVHSPLTCSPTSINTSDFCWLVCHWLAEEVVLQAEALAVILTGAVIAELWKTFTILACPPIHTAAHVLTRGQTLSASAIVLAWQRLAFIDVGLKKTKTWTHVNKFSEKKSETNNSSPSLFQVL